MARHAKPVFGQLEQQKLLQKLGETRRELIHYQESMEFRSVGRGVVDTVVKNIDDVAYFLTGKRDHFWGKPVR